MSKPRELHFTSRTNPYPTLGYHMEKCTSDIFTQEKDWVFVEKAAYDKCITMLKYVIGPTRDVKTGKVKDLLKELGEI